MKFQDLEQKYNSQLLERLQERFHKWKSEFEQKVNINLQNSLSEHMTLLEDARNETKKTKADSERLLTDIKDKHSKESKQLENKLSEMEKQQSGYLETITEHTQHISILEENLSSERNKKDASLAKQRAILKQIDELNEKN